MNQTEKDSLINLYHDRYREIGYNVQTLGWKNKEEQVLRFKILSEIADLSNSSICDIGCGFGDMIPFLEENFSNFSYLGIDIASGLIEEAKKKYPQGDFLCTDILQESFDTHFDYFLLSGALSYKIGDNWSFTKQMLTKMFNLSRKGIAVNFLSTYVNFQHPRNFHYSPETMFAFAKTLTKKVSIRHDYPLWEFTIYLYK